MLSSNFNAIELLKSHPEKINPYWLSFNTNIDVIPLLETMSNDDIDWYILSERHNLEFMDFIERRINDGLDLDLLNWVVLSANSHAINILINNIDMIDWTSLGENPNPDVIPLLEIGIKLDKIDWTSTSTNRNMFPFLKLHLDKVNWFELSKLPDIFIVKKDLATITQTLNLICS